jgi:hypothetical protein
MLKNLLHVATAQKRTMRLEALDFLSIAYTASEQKAADNLGNLLVNARSDTGTLFAQPVGFRMLDVGFWMWKIGPFWSTNTAPAPLSAANPCRYSGSIKDQGGWAQWWDVPSQ